MAATGTVDITAAFTYTSTSALATFTGQPKIQSTTTLSSSDISKVYAAPRSISTADTLNVTSGLSDAYGNALVFTIIEAVVIQNTSASATLVVGGGTHPLFGTDQYTVQAGQTLPLLPTITVSGTVNTVTVTPSAAATYNVIIAGN